MNDTNKTLSGPDLVEGLALSSIADGAMLLGHAHGEPALLARQAMTCSRSAPSVPIMERRLSKACSPRRRFAARGIMPASASVPARRSARRRSTPSPAGASSSGTARCMCGNSSRRQHGRFRARPARRDLS